MTYVIRETRTYFGPAIGRTLVQDGMAGAKTFPTRAAARHWVEEQETEVYHLSHLECQRPEYAILRADRLPFYLLEQL